MANYIQQLRKKRGLSASVVADLINISQGYYSHIENGSRTPRKELLNELAKVLGAPVTKLLTEFENNKVNNYAGNNWILKIRINDEPVLEAFKKDQFLLRSSPDNELLISTFIKFIEYNIRDSIREELNGTQMEKFLIEKLKF